MSWFLTGKKFFYVFVCVFKEDWTSSFFFLIYFLDFTSPKGTHNLRHMQEASRLFGNVKMIHTMFSIFLTSNNTRGTFVINRILNLICVQLPTQLMKLSNLFGSASIHTFCSLTHLRSRKQHTNHYILHICLLK